MWFFVQDHYSTQQSMVNEREPVVLPAYFDQVGPSYVRTWEVQRKITEVFTKNCCRKLADLF
jgi:allantoicase